MTLADEQSASFQGWNIMTLRKGDREINQPMWGAEIEFEGIRGLDFFQKYNCQVVLKDDHYELQFETYSSPWVSSIILMKKKMVFHVFVKITENVMLC